MSKFWKTVGIGAVVVLLFDTVVSFASLVFSFPYSYASVGSFLIYATIGYFVFHSSSVRSCVGAALLVGLIDSTLGWFISWKIGPGVIPSTDATISMIAVTIIFVMVNAIICALFGAGIAQIITRRNS